ncbi:MAG: hypothetical protein ACLGHG_02275 [Gammaproteobacteria bacterium]
MSLRTPAIALELRSSALYGLLLAVLMLSALAAALASHHAWWLKSLLLVAVAGLLYRAWHDGRVQGARYLALSPEGRLTVGYRNGTAREADCAGYALLGSWVIFVFVAPEKASGATGLGSLLKRLFAVRPERIAVLCDATDADSFRRLRSRLRLRLPSPPS